METALTIARQRLRPSQGAEARDDPASQIRGEAGLTDLLAGGLAPGRIRHALGSVGAIRSE